MGYNGFITYPSFNHAALDGCAQDRIEKLSESIDSLGPFEDKRDYFATSVLSESINLNFDSEKIKASNKKINEVKNALGADEGAYFVPVVRDIPQKELTKYNNKGLNVYGVNWLLNQINAPFSENDYFTFLETTIAPLLEEKGL